MKAEYVLLVGFASALAAFAASTYIMIRFYIRLKRQEHETWLALGSPMPTLDRSKAFDDFAKTRSFLRNGGHRSLRDKQSARLGDLVRLTDRLFLGVAICVSIITGCILLFVEP